MKKIRIESTAENKARQKLAYHNTSSTVFLGVCNEDGSVDTEISLLNHFLLKRGIEDVTASIEFRDINGCLVHCTSMRLSKPKTYSIKVFDFLKSSFVGSVYVFFESGHNLAVPFCAVTVAIKTYGSLCGVHTYGRRLEDSERGGRLDLSNTVEMGWTARDTDSIKSFAVLHGGNSDLNVNVVLEILNEEKQILKVESNRSLPAYGTLIIVPQDLSEEVVAHLAGSSGHITVHVQGLAGVFPRMLCGNYVLGSNAGSALNEALEMQFTHTNFDFSTVEQPDSDHNSGYFNQPYLPDGYGIFYPVAHTADVCVGGRPYEDGTVFQFEAKSLSQVVVASSRQNLPSRFVGASVSVWDGAMLESECSTGTFIKDYLKVPCHWHWGLLKPGFEEGSGIISILVNNFCSGDPIVGRQLNFRLYDEEGLLVEEILTLEKSFIIEAASYLQNKLTSGTVWYVLSGDKLEDLNVFSTFSPNGKSGFVEHAF